MGNDNYSSISLMSSHVRPAWIGGACLCSWLLLCREGYFGFDIINNGNLLYGSCNTCSLVFLILCCKYYLTIYDFLINDIKCFQLIKMFMCHFLLAVCLWRFLLGICEILAGCSKGIFQSKIRYQLFMMLCMW